MVNKIWQLLVLSVRGLVAFGLMASVPAAAIELNASDELKSVTDQIVADGVYTRDELKQLFAEITLDQGVLKTIKKPAEGISWHRYKNIFLKEKRISDGAKFWVANQELLSRVTAEYGVPAKYLVALLGVETFYGTRMGSRQVFRSLATLSAGYPRRSAFFSKELGTFLRLMKTEQLIPSDVQGSYAGAIGIPQFMPSSYKAYAVDFNHDGTRDLVNQLEDALGSVGNYLAVHGWQRDGAVRTWLPQPVKPALIAEVSKKAKPRIRVSSLKQLGLKPDILPAAAKDKQKVSIGKLDEESGMRYFLGFQNFYAITRYNPSNKYAMAICELADAIEAEMQQ